MDNRLAYTNAVVLLAVGILLALAIWAGIGQLAGVLAQKPFYGSGGSFIVPDRVVSLSGDRFATVSSGQIDVFRVDASGRVQKLDSVETYVPGVRRRVPYDGQRTSAIDRTRALQQMATILRKGR